MNIIRVKNGHEWASKELLQNLNYSFKIPDFGRLNNASPCG